MLEYRDWYGTRHWSERKVGDRRFTIQYIVLHGTDGPRDAALTRWSSTDNPSGPSAHDLIDATGLIWRCVPYDKAANHTSGGHIPGFNQLDPATGRYEPDVNLASIGIELEYPAAPDSPPWPRPQIDAAVEHVRRLVQTYRIPRANILRHADIAQDQSDPRNLALADFVNRVFQEVNSPLLLAVRNAAWNAGGIPHNPEAAFPSYARTHDLGNPETPEFDFAISGQRFRGQGFSKCIIYAPVGQWDRIREVLW